MDYFAAFKLWEATPPPFLDDLLALPAGLELSLTNGQVRLPWPMFRAEEIASAFAILRDWDIPNNFIPVGGDFHDILCLDVSRPVPDLVLIDDARHELARFPNPSDFFAGRVQLPIATPSESKRFRRPSLCSFTAKWSCPWPMAC